MGPFVVASLPKETRKDIRAIRVFLGRIADAVEFMAYGHTTTATASASAEPVGGFEDTGLYDTNDQDMALVEVAEAHGMTPEELYRILQEEAKDPRRYDDYDESTDNKGRA